MIAVIAHLTSLAVSVLLLSSCATYQYRIVEPPVAAGPLSRQEAIVFPWHPLEYQAIQAHDRLGLLIVNPTDDPVMLLGERSYVVDPTGETHAPMRSRSIAPRSRITMALPPAPTYAPARPRVGIGVGVSSGYRGAGFGTGLYSQWAGYPYWGGYPHYVHVQDGGPFWRWTTGTVRMRLAFEQFGERFIHDFTFERVRVR